MLLIAHAAHDLQAVEPGQHQVEDDEVGAAFGNQPESRWAVGGGAHLITGALQVARDDLGDRRLVVDHENRPAGVAMAVRDERLHRPIVPPGRAGGDRRRGMFRIP